MAADNSPEQPWPVIRVNKVMGDYIARLGDIWVEGQLSQVNIRPGASQVFMSLRDVSADATLSLVASTKVFQALQPPPEPGARVVVLGKFEFWAKRGGLHLRARAIKAVGLGELLAQLERLRATLAAEGLFDERRKRPLPFLPRRVGLITGRRSDAERDVLTNARRRWPAVEFEVRSVAVQGVAAVPEVTAALRELDALDDVDVIVIARGGGSVEDLLPFSNEDLVRTAALAATPIVSAIGHERDHPLLDDVADFRASTPTDAARRIVPDLAEEQARLDRLRQALRTQLTAGINDEHRRIESLRRSGALAQAINRIPAEQELLQRTRRDARRAVEALLAGASERLDGLQHRLHALSPAATLERGYAIVVSEGGSIAREPADVVPGSRFRVRLFGGSFTGERPLTDTDTGA